MMNKKREKHGFLSVITSKVSVYVVRHINYSGGKMTIGFIINIIIVTSIIIIIVIIKIVVIMILIIITL